MIRGEDPLSQVIRVIEESRYKIAIVVDDSERVQGAITDGDVRRALLAGSGLDLPAEKAMNPEPHLFAETSTREAMVLEAGRLGLRHFPIVDPDGRLVRMESLRSLAQSSKDHLREEPVLILAGGRGTRLLPLTENCPKPMLPIGGKPILQHIIERLKSSGFSTFFISVNYLAEQIEAHFGDGSDRGVSIAYLHEDNPLGTGGPVSLLPDSVGEQPVLVVNGDILSQVDFAGLVDFHAESGAATTMCIRPHGIQVPFGVVEHEDGQVRALVEKPTFSVQVNAGIYVVGPLLRARLQRGEAIDMPELISRGVNAGDRVMVFPVHEEWVDVGRHTDLNAVREKHER